MKSFVHLNEMTHDMAVVGHIPKLKAEWVTKFLKRATNSKTVLIKGKRVKRGLVMASNSLVSLRLKEFLLRLVN
jgi:molybdate-binding protein